MTADHQTADKRAAILRAALRIISERGFHDAPVSLIAKEAGVSAGIIYHYFDNKDALIDELYRAIKRSFGAACSAGLAPDQPLHAQFRRMWINTFRYYLRHPDEAAFMQQYANSPYYDPAMEHEFTDDFRAAYDLVERARREQVIKDIPEAVLYAFTLDMAGLLAQKHAAGLLVMDDALIEQVAAMCWDAIRR